MSLNKKLVNRHDSTPTCVEENYVKVNISPAKHYSSKVSALLAIAIIAEKNDMELGEIAENLTNNFHAINAIVSLKRRQREIANELQKVTNDLILAIG